jgi:hypothetical protein
MNNVLWVVYKMVVKNHPDGMNAVCQQADWDALEAARPGQQPLVQGSIASEGAAEQIARDTAGDQLRGSAGVRISTRRPRPEPSTV